MIEPFINIPANRQQLFFNNRALANDNLSLEGVGIREGDMISVFQSRQPQQGRPDARRDDDAEVMRIQALANREILRRLREHAPALADAVNDPQRFGQMYRDAMNTQREQAAEKERAYAKLNEDPFDVEAQKKIEEIIRLERVQENLDQALEDSPEGIPTCFAMKLY